VLLSIDDIIGVDITSKKDLKSFARHDQGYLNDQLNHPDFSMLAQIYRT